MYEEQARRGAELLDQEVPDWYKKIDLEELVLSKPCKCVLGQVWKAEKGVESFLYGLNFLNVHGDEYGFAAIHPNFTDADWAKLDEAWITEILNRQVKLEEVEAERELVTA